jgi:hypothetical protein
MNKIDEEVGNLEAPPFSSPKNKDEDKTINDDKTYLPEKDQSNYEPTNFKSVGIKAHL